MPDALSYIAFLLASIAEPVPVFEILQSMVRGDLV